MNFGTLERGRGCWVIRAEPHVRARLKRVFARAPQQAGDEIRVSDTPENARDLRWFIERYPLQVLDAGHLDRQARRHENMELRLNDLLSARHPPADVQLAVPAREYQKLAAHALTIRGGLLLADDVGLGKTVSGICPMATSDNLPALVVCEAHLPQQWVKFLHRFTPDLRVHVLKTGAPYDLIGKPSKRQNGMWPDRLPDVIISNYHKLRGWAETLAGVCRYVVFDECQRLRHPGSQIYQAAVHVARKATLRIGLSATPIYNYGHEFFWVVDALLPGALGTREEFIREWCNTKGGEDKARIQDTEQFGAYLRREGIMLRRTRAEVGRELPPLTKVAHTIDADTEVLNKLTGDAVELARIIVSRNESYRGQQMRAAGEFDTLMRQATGIAKAPYVAEFVRLLVENGEPVILYGWHRDVYAIWLERLKDLNPVMFTGSESAPQKEAAKQDFIEGRSQVLIMSLRAGAGVDELQGHCRTVVFGELDWSPGVHEQCIGRAWRDGQPEPVVAYYLLSEDGSDPVVSDVLGVKREQIEGVRNPGTPLVERIETGEHQIRKLAEALLAARGQHVTTQETVVPLAKRESDRHMEEQV